MGLSGARKISEEATPQGGINHGLSVYLDLVRVSAAVIVMIAHAEVSHLILPLPLVLDLAPVSVIVFFVLSGYIIESTTRRNAGYKVYVAHRVARIYSVALPAVILSFVCAGGIALANGHNATQLFVSGWGQWWRLPIVLMFQGEDWFSAVEVPWNGPFWSLHYEVADYIIFGILQFLRGRMRLVTALAFFLIVGPKILLLFPCWWIGVELARRPSIQFPSQHWAGLAFILAPIAIVVLARARVAFDVQRKILSIFPKFYLFDHSQPFITHYAIAVLVAASFAAARQLNWLSSVQTGRYGATIRWLSGYTFSLYLYHRPLQSLASQFYRVKDGEVLIPLFTQFAIVGIIVLIGFFTERRTKMWRIFVTRHLTRLP